MAAVMTLQALHDYSDRETAETVRFDVRWKPAIGAALDDPGFDPSTLVYWRRRIAKSARPHRVNDAVAAVASSHVFAHYTVANLRTWGWITAHPPRALGSGFER